MAHSWWRAFAVGLCLWGIACHRPATTSAPSGPCGMWSVLAFVTLRDGGDCDNESAPNGLTRSFLVKGGPDASFSFIPLDGAGDPRPDMNCQGGIDSCHLDLSCSGTIAADVAGAPDREVTEAYDVDLRPDGGSSGTESVDVTRMGQSCQGEYVVAGVGE